MNTATVHPYRLMLPVLNLLVAGAAVTLGVVAIATDDAGSITESPPVATAALSRCRPSPDRRGRRPALPPMMPLIAASPFPASW